MPYDPGSTYSGATAGNTKPAAGSTPASGANTFPGTGQSIIGTTEFDDLFNAHAGLAPAQVQLTPDSQPVSYQTALQSITRLSTAEIISLQTQLKTAGLITGQPSGIIDGSTATAWQKVVADALRAATTLQYTQSKDPTGKAVLKATPVMNPALSSVSGMLGMAATSGSYTKVEQALADQALQLQGQISATKSATVHLTDPAALGQARTAANEELLGMAPTDKQITDFVNKFHGKESSDQTSGIGAAKAAQAADLARIKDEQAQLMKLGPNGLDSFLQAYQTALHDDGTAVGVKNPSLGPTELPIAPRGGSVVDGGIYGLSPIVWQKGLQQLGFTSDQMNKISASPGQAPQALQTAVASWFAQQQFNKFGNWSDVAAVMAGGQALSELGKGDKQQATATASKGEGPYGSMSISMQTFAHGLVAKVNQALANIQSEINAPGATVVTTTTTPDAGAEAAKEAKESDPEQFYAHTASNNYALVANALYGQLPLAYQAPGANSGPVAPDAGVAA